MNDKVRTVDHATEFTNIMFQVPTMGKKDKPEYLAKGVCVQNMESCFTLKNEDLAKECLDLFTFCQLFFGVMLRLFDPSGCCGGIELQVFIPEV